MPAPDHLAAFALASVILIVIPGPAVLFVVGRSLTLGRRGGFLSVVGNELGGLPLVTAVALGIGALVTASEIAFTTVKIVGAAYLVYLGVQAIRHRREGGVGSGTTPVRRSPLRLLAQGFLVGLTNPKTIVFFVAVLPQFVDVSRGPAWMQMMTYGILFLLIALVCDSAWALVAGTAREWFARSPRRLARVRGTGGVMMVGLGGVLLFTGSKH